MSNSMNNFKSLEQVENFFSFKQSQLNHKDCHFRLQNQNWDAKNIEAKVIKYSLHLEMIT